MSREDLCRFAAMCGLRSETHPRCSTLFLGQLYIQPPLGMNPAKITAEVSALEGYDRESRTKEAAPFKNRPLLGLWHKHYLAHNAFARNMQQGLGGPKLKRLRDVIKSHCIPGATHFTVEDAPRIAKAVTNVYWERADRKQLTGEWIVFAKHDGQNYYLCLGNHDEDDQEIYGRIQQACTWEFPFLDALLNHEPPENTKSP